MQVIRKTQPLARRIVRAEFKGTSDLVHRFVPRDAGLDALVDAVTADLPQAQ